MFQRSIFVKRRVLALSAPVLILVIISPAPLTPATPYCHHHLILIFSSSFGEKSCYFAIICQIVCTWFQLTKKSRILKI